MKTSNNLLGKERKFINTLFNMSTTQINNGPAKGLDSLY